MSQTALKIKVVSYSTSGGAGGAGNSLLQGFLHLGLDASFQSISQSNLRVKPFEHPRITAAAGFDNYIVRASGWNSLVSLTRDSPTVPMRIQEDVDLVVLRWMNGVSIELAPASNTKVVWVLDDMNPFTGACHYSLECNRFASGCVSCPAVRYPFRKKVALNLARKSAWLERFTHLGFIAPTKWMHNQFLTSQLASRYQSKVIYNPLNPAYLDLELTPHPAKSQMQGPLKVLIVAANLDDPIKGIWDVAPALRDLIDTGKIALTLAGFYSTALRTALPDATFLGELSPSRVALEMRISDLLLVPSLAETAGAIVAEAASQKTPALVRNVGGLPEMVGFSDRGWIFSEAKELQAVLGGIDRRKLEAYGELCRLWAEALRPEVIAKEVLAFSRLL